MSNNLDPDQARQKVWTQIRHDDSSGLIWVQTGCQGYQQTALVDKHINGLEVKVERKNVIIKTIFTSIALFFISMHVTLRKIESYITKQN